MRDPPKIQEIVRVRNGCKVFRVRLKGEREREKATLWIGEDCQNLNLGFVFKIPDFMLTPQHRFCYNRDFILAVLWPWLYQMKL